MGMAKRAPIYIILLITLFALSCYDADAASKKVRKPPIGGPDIHAGRDIATLDDLLPGEKVHNVMDFGAVPDGETDSTQAFMDAWAATRESPVKSRFLVPPGRFLIEPMFLNGPCKFNGPIVMQIDGTVLASTDLSTYVNDHWLRIEDHFDLTITGVGSFDGQGQNAWSIVEDCDEKTQGACVKNPASLYFSNVTNGVVAGIKSVNPKGSHIFLTSSANFRMTNLEIIAPETSPNTDGIHISHSHNVIISKTFIGTGDDCIGMIQGSSEITIDDVTCGPGHGISIGSLGKVEGEAEVRGVYVKNSRLVKTRNGLRIKAWPGHKFPGAAADVFFTNITMEDVKYAIIIDQEYLCPKDCTKQPSLVKIKNVHFTNIRGTTIAPTPVNMKCSRLNPCEGIVFRDINFQIGNTLKKITALNSSCINVIPTFEGIQIPPPCLNLPLMPKLPTAPAVALLPPVVVTKPVPLPIITKPTLSVAPVIVPLPKKQPTLPLKLPGLAKKLRKSGKKQKKATTAVTLATTAEPKLPPVVVALATPRRPRMSKATLLKILRKQKLAKTSAKKSKKKVKAEKQEGSRKAKKGGRKAKNMRKHKAKQDKH